MRMIRFFFPGKSFPSVSVTGEQCSLHCKHCDGHYLRNMISADDPDKLIKLSREFEAQGKKGFLLSGGCTVDGHIPLKQFYKAIKQIKRKTNLIINAHLGLIEKNHAEELANLDIDVVSVDVVGSTETIQQVYGLKKTTDDYENMLLALAQAGMEIVPHICVGLHFGKLKGEFRALEMIKRIKPKAIVITSLIPTKNTYMQDIKVNDEDIITVIEKAKEDFFPVPIMLGCMRLRKNKDLELKAIRAGIDGIAVPSTHTIAQAEKENLVIKKVETCCAIVD